jgi:macrolide transport system ATP-binding/permease protein
MSKLFQDLRYAARMLRNNPGFAIVAVVTLALGIGANSTVFSLIGAVLLRPLPGLSEPDRAVTIGRTFHGQGFDNSSSPNYRDLRDQNTVFTAVAAEHPLPVSLSEGGHSERLKGSVVTPNFFRTLGVRLALGRGFLDSEDVGGNAPASVVISYGAWQRQFGSNPDIIGKTVFVDGTPMTVVGVTARGFIGSDPTSIVDVWVPMGAARQVLPSWIDLDETLRQRDWMWIKLYAHLKPGVSFEQANAEVQTIAARLQAAYPELKENAIGWAVARGVGLDPDERNEFVRLTGILFGVVALLLLLACANVSNLLLARATARKREISIRLALGAPRMRLVRQLLTESILLAILGGLAGLALSFWAAAALSRFFAASFRFSLAVDLAPDWRVLAFTFIAAALAGIGFGLAPALHSSRTDLAGSLKEAVLLAPRRSRLRPVLVATQLALSLVLLAGAGLLLRTLWNFNQIRPGFNSRDLALMTVEPTHTGNYDVAQLQAFYTRLLERLQALPGVESATLARVAPVSAQGWGVNARFPDKPDNPNHGLPYNSVAPNYFEMMDIPIVRGRGFTLQDSAVSSRVMVINETMAKTIWPTEDAIGKQVIVADEKVPRQVVGIVPDIKYRSLLEKPRPFAYFSMWQPYPLPDAPTVIHLRTHLPLAELAAGVQREVQVFDPNLPIFDVKTVSDHIADSYWRQRMTGLLISIFASLALLLGIAGMYGVMAYVVAERRHEVGIRMALGARPTDIVRLILREGARMIAAGVAAGTAGALAATQLLKTLLYGVKAGDPVTLVAAASVLVAAGLLASYIPARRATKVDPMVALRYE